MPVGTGAGAASGLAFGWVWRPMCTGTARPIERPSKRTSMSVRSKGLKTSSALRPTKAASTSKEFP